MHLRKNMFISSISLTQNQKIKYYEMFSKDHVSPPLFQTGPKKRCPITDQIAFVRKNI